MQKLNYKVVNKNSNIRWQNRDNFVQSVSGTKKNNIAILSIHFNNFQNTKRLIDYLWTEKNQNFDIILIENSTKELEKNQLFSYIQQFSNITYISSLSNLGSAWWYALWMEFIMHHGYEYFYLVEDDVIFLENNVFTDLITKSNSHTLTFIHNCKNTRDSEHTKNIGKSRWVQTAWYSIDFVKKVGIIDPRYFFRGEDLEWAIRIQQWIKKYAYDISVVDHNYLHPYLKSVNGNNAWFYFSIRNQLLTLNKHLLRYYKFFATLFLYLFTGITYGFVKNDWGIYNSLLIALKDFFANKYTFENNTTKISQFIQNRKNQTSPKIITFDKLRKITRKMYGNSKILALSWTDLSRLSFSSSLSHILSFWILISSSSTVFYPLTLLAPKIICIEEFDIEKNMVYISQYKNKHLILNAFLVVIAFGISIFVSFVVNFIVILYIALLKIL